MLMNNCDMKWITGEKVKADCAAGPWPIRTFAGQEIPARESIVYDAPYAEPQRPPATSADS